MVGIWSVNSACNGLLCGLVSITAGAATVPNWSAVLIGVIGGGIYYGASFALLRKAHVDDAVDACAVRLTAQPSDLRSTECMTLTHNRKQRPPVGSLCCE